MQRFDKLDVSQLKVEQKKRGILDLNIKGTGKNGNILKMDRVVALDKYEESNKKKEKSSPTKGSGRGKSSFGGIGKQTKRKATTKPRAPKPKKTTKTSPKKPSNELIDKQVLIDNLVKHNYRVSSYLLGLKVHMNDDQYIDISREPNNILSLDVYNKKGIDPNSLELLEDYGRIRATSLIRVLHQVKHKFEK